MTSASTATGRMVPSFVDSYRIPRIPRYLPPIIYCHGVSGDSTEMLGGAGVPSVRSLLYRVVNHEDGGWPIVSVSMPGTWGNATTISRIDAALAWARANLPCDPLAPPPLIGTSHGGCNVMTYAYQREVGPVVGILPAADLQTLRVNNVVVSGLPLRTSVDTAWGVTYPTALPAAADPAAHLALLKFKKFQFWYASNDDVSVNITTIGATLYADLHNVGATGHSDTSVAAVDPNLVVAHLRQAA